MHYELKDLRLFQAIAEAGNLSAGAAAMLLTASSASYRLKNLEYAVGSPLFIRTPKGMSLTSAGEVLARFLTTNTNFNVDLKEQESPTISQAIEEGQADIGVGAGLEERPGLRRELYAVDQLVCVVPPGHPLTHAPSIAFGDVLAHDLVSVDRNSSNFLYLSHQARLAGLPMQVRVHVHNFSALIYMVQAGVGAAVVPFSTAQEAARQGLVVALPLTDPWAARELYLVHANEPGQADLVREFAGILLDDPQVAATRGED